MPKKDHDQEVEIKNAIRDVLAVNPLISMRSLVETLARKNYKTADGNPLHRVYVGRLVRKVWGDMRDRVDRQTSSDRLALIKERHRLVYERLMRIAFYTDDLQKEGAPPPAYRDQIRALTEIIKLDLAILNAEMDLGIFERNLGAIDIEAHRNQPLPPELKEAILNTAQKWGIVKTVSAKEIKTLPDGHSSQNNKPAAAAAGTKPGAAKA